ncbi:MAG: hypothetical protein K0A93_12850 [Desulfuromonadaceae bacterium]|nr:hypothetical protein [Desulfuromonadaceae bacterium]
MNNRWFNYGKGLLVMAAGVVIMTLPTFAAGIRDTKHNLSAGGPGSIKALDEGELCIFCHTPHQGRQDIPYLWNRADSTAVYIPYQSSTLYAAVGQPTGASKLCLSCHDGTVALGMLGSRPEEIPFVGGLRFMPAGPSRLGTDLSTSHPVSLVYDAALAASNPALNSPASLVHPLHLDKTQQLQCSTCHDPHDDTFDKFLVMSNQNSQLCTVCHSIPGWADSAHALSNASWNGVGTDPWPDSPYTTVAENGCASCHKSHSAGSSQRLLRYVAEEDNCLSCHNGNVAATNIAPELTKPYRHAVQDYIEVHDPIEDFTSGTVAKHVECADCHNPHHANSQPGATPGDPPLVSGATAGVSGIDIGGGPVSPALYNYEICFKCHSDTQMLGTAPITRQLDQFNTRLEFDPANPSFHPLASLGVNADVPSLLTPWTEQSRIDCSCHNNSPSLGPQGPHGVSITQGNSINNRHLINFNLDIVAPDAQGRLYFEDQGTFTGQCFLNCHGVAHEPKGY